MSTDRDMTEVREYQAGRTKIPKTKQIPLRIPEDRDQAVDARMLEVGERSKNAWINRAIQNQLDRPVEVTKEDVKT